MKKSFIFSMTTALMMGTVVLSSCSSDELPFGNEAQIAKEAAKTYSFSVSAVMDDEADTRVFEIGESTIKSSFSTSEKVYVYIKRGDVIAYGNLPLTPSNVSSDGQSCTLDTPKDFYFISETPNFAPEANDEVYLYYGMDPDPNSKVCGYYDFSTHGTKEDVEKKDFCLAEMVVTGVDKNKNLTFGQKDNPTKTNFSFTNINSIFRQKLTFSDADGYPINPTITKVVISSENNKTVKRYTPFGGNGAYEYGPIEIEMPSSGIDYTSEFYEIYFSTIFTDENNDKAITFTAYSIDGKTYSLTKDLPRDGFQNNTYYYGDAELKWASDYVKPIIMGAKEFSEDIAYNVGIRYTFNDNPTNISISGDGTQSVFLLPNGGTVTLDNVNLFNKERIPNYPVMFLSGANNKDDLTLNLKGDNIISMIDGGVPFMGLKGNLHLKCEGDQATLTIRAEGDSNNYSGFGAFNNIDFKNIRTSDPFGQIESESDEGYSELQVIAVDDDGDGDSDYIIQRGAISVYSGEIYQWTFTVKKIKE